MKDLLQQILLAGMLFLVTGTPARAQSDARLLEFPSLSPFELEQLQAITRKLSADCKPPHCLMLFIGRSLAIFPPYLESKSITNHLMLPISGLQGTDDILQTFQKNPTPTEMDLSLFEGAFLEMLFNRYFTKAANLKETFQKFIARPILEPALSPGVTTVKVVDFTGTGASLVLSSLLIKQYFRDTHPQIDVQAIACTDSYRMERNTLGKRWGTLLKDQGIRWKFLRLDERLQKSGQGLWPRMNGPSESSADQMADMKSHAPYDHSNIHQLKRAPKIRKTYRRPNLNNPRRKAVKASYRDLVRWFQDPDFKNKIEKHHCNELLQYYRSSKPLMQPDGFFIQKLR